MKLYTEEQVRESYQSGFRLAMETDGGLKEGQQEFINSITPIELPSDEEIDAECRELPYEKHLDDGQYNDGQMAGFELGAYWMRQQILNQNK